MKSIELGNIIRTRRTLQISPPSNCHPFASMGHSLAEQRFANFKKVEKWLVEWFPLEREKVFFWNGIHDLP